MKKKKQAAFPALEMQLVSTLGFHFFGMANYQDWVNGLFTGLYLPLRLSITERKVVLGQNSSEIDRPRSLIIQTYASCRKVG